MSIRLLARLASLALLLLSHSAVAQPLVHEELLERRFALQGDGIKFCIGTGNPITEFDKSVAEEIANALLLKPEFLEIRPDFPLYEENDLQERLYLLLLNECDAFVGVDLAPYGHPEWLTFSKPYAGFPYVAVVVNPEYQSVGDIPGGAAIGVPVLSRIDRQLISYSQAQSPEARWRRLPYADTELLLSRLLDGTLEAALFWAPELDQLLPTVEASSEIRVISTRPLAASMASLGVAFLADSTYLRAAIDDAITALIDDGTITQLLEVHGLTGVPGGSD